MQAPNSSTWGPATGTTWTPSLNPATGALTSTLTVAPTLTLDGYQFQAVFTNSQAPSGVATTPAAFTVVAPVATAWNFNSLSVGTNLTPAPLTGTGSAESIGMSSLHDGRQRLSYANRHRAGYLQHPGE